MIQTNAFPSWTGPAAALTLLLPFAATRAKAAPQKVKLDLYVMSLCPFGVQAENGVLPAVKSLAKYIDFNLYFIGGAAPGGDGLPKFTALHGEQEVQENIRQVCAKTLSPDKYMDYILERNKAVKGPEWKGAAQVAGLDSAKIAKIEECSKGPQGAAWYSKNIEVSQARGANASPTIDINGRPYARARTQGWVTLALCDSMKADGIVLPKACQEAEVLAANEKASGADEGCGGPSPSTGRQAAAGAAAPAAFNITIVTEVDCKICAPTLLDNMAALHPGAKIRTVDANSKEGRELLKLHGAKTLPLYVLDSTVEQDTSFSRLLPVAYYKSQDAYLIRHGPTNFFPSVQLTRKRVPRHLDIFLESLSLVSAQAEQDLIQFLIAEEKTLKDLTFSFHFLVSESIADNAKAPSGAGPSVRTATLAELPRRAETTLLSPRGDVEIEEDIRQLCIFQHQPIGILFTYLACRNRRLTDASQAQRCLNAGEAVKSCMAATEGKNLLRQDAQLARELELSRAPAFLWENRYGPFGFNEVDWRDLLKGSQSSPSRQVGEGQTVGKGG